MTDGKGEGEVEGSVPPILGELLIARAGFMSGGVERMPVVLNSTTIRGSSSNFMPLLVSFCSVTDHVSKGVTFVILLGNVNK